MLISSAMIFSSKRTGFEGGFSITARAREMTIKVLEESKKSSEFRRTKTQKKMSIEKKITSLFA